jgi:hypothetical protein
MRGVKATRVPRWQRQRGEDALRGLPGRFIAHKLNSLHSGFAAKATKIHVPSWTRRRAVDTWVKSPHFFAKNSAIITRLSDVIRPKGSDLIFDHPYNADIF